MLVFRLTFGELDAIISMTLCILFGISFISMIACTCIGSDRWFIFWICMVLATFSSTFIYANWGYETLRKKLLNQEAIEMENENVWKYVTERVPDSSREVLVGVYNGGVEAVDIGMYFANSKKWLLKSLAEDVVVKWAELPKEPEIKNEELDVETTKVILEDLRAKINSMKFDVAEVERTLDLLSKKKEVK